MEQGNGKKTHCVQVSFQKECLFTGLVMSGKKRPTIKAEEKEAIRQTILGMFSPDMHETRKQYFLSFPTFTCARDPSTEMEGRAHKRYAQWHQAPPTPAHSMGWEVEILWQRH